VWRPVRVGCATRVRCVVDVARGGRAALWMRHAEAALRVRAEGFDTLLCSHLVVPERADAGAVRVSGLHDVLSDAWCPAASGRVCRNLSPGPDFVLYAER
jgi:hypothetical protein